MRPTAANILRDNEILRIKDIKTRNARIDDVLAKHAENLRSEREQWIMSKGYDRHNPDRAKRQKKNNIYDEQKKDQKNRRESKIENKNMEISEEQNNQDNDLSNSNHIVNKKEDAFFSKFKEENKNINDYSFESIMTEIIKKNFLEGNHDMDLELKKNEDMDIIYFFFMKFENCSIEKREKIFQIYKDKLLTFVDVISKTLIELSSFLSYL